VLPVKHQVSLTITSLLALLFFTIHWAFDVVLGFEPGRGETYIGVAIVIAWLYPLLVLAGRKLGYIINLVFSLLSALVPYLHMRGSGLLSPRTVTLEFGPKFFWVWTLFGLCIAGALGFLLSLHGLASLRAARRSSS
jgi:hypothetical protein